MRSMTMEHTVQSAATARASRVDLTWIEKYITFEQSPDGSLRPTDHHFLAEVCYRDPAQMHETRASLLSAESLLATYDGNDPRTFTNGYYYTRKSKSYDDLAALEAAHPARDSYVWQLEGGGERLRLAPIRIGGPDGRTAIPEPSPIYLSQRREPVRDTSRVRPDEPLTVSWRPFASGAHRAGTVWQDLIFVLLSDQNGEVVYTSGAPGAESGFLDFTQTATEVPAGTLKGGSSYVVFISQVKYVDHNVDRGIDQLAANSFAVELPIRVAGESQPRSTCIRRAPYLWAGKTPREKGLVPWPGFPTTARS
jgi:hypothetical protein